MLKQTKQQADVNKPSNTIPVCVAFLMFVCVGTVLLAETKRHIHTEVTDPNPDIVRLHKIILPTVVPSTNDTLSLFFTILPTHERRPIDVPSDTTVGGLKQQITAMTGIKISNIIIGTSTCADDAELSDCGVCSEMVVDCEFESVQHRVVRVIGVFGERYDFTCIGVEQNQNKEIHFTKGNCNEPFPNEELDWIYTQNGNLYKLMNVSGEVIKVVTWIQSLKKIADWVPGIPKWSVRKISTNPEFNQTVEIYFTYSDRRHAFNGNWVQDDIGVDFPVKMTPDKEGIILRAVQQWWT